MKNLVTLLSVAALSVVALPETAEAGLLCGSRSCCAPAPVCCAPAPVCAPAPMCCAPTVVTCMPAPVTCCPQPVCKPRRCLLKRLFHCHKPVCAPACAPAPCCAPAPVAAPCCGTAYSHPYAQPYGYGVTAQTAHWF